MAITSFRLYSRYLSTGIFVVRSSQFLSRSRSHPEYSSASHRQLRSSSKLFHFPTPCFPPGSHALYYGMDNQSLLAVDPVRCKTIDRSFRNQDSISLCASIAVARKQRLPPPNEAGLTPLKSSPISPGVRARGAGCKIVLARQRGVSPGVTQTW